jgi:hypothetical protein
MEFSAESRCVAANEETADISTTIVYLNLNQRAETPSSSTIHELSSPTTSLIQDLKNRRDKLWRYMKLNRSFLHVIIINMICATTTNSNQHGGFKHRSLRLTFNQKKFSGKIKADMRRLLADNDKDFTPKGLNL